MQPDEKKKGKISSFFLFVETIFLLCITAPIFEMLTGFDVAAAADHVAPQIKSEIHPGFDRSAVLKCGFLVFLRLNYRRFLHITGVLVVFTACPGFCVRGYNCRC